MLCVDDRPRLYTVDGGVLSLSGPALKEFLAAVLARGAPFRFKARGMSMDPFIKDGDVITVSPHGRSLRVGDVVAYCQPPDDHLVVHRVVARSSDGRVLMRGDVNDKPDGRFAAASVLGRVDTVSRLGRSVRFGRGPERLVIALLSRFGLLSPLVYQARRAARSFRDLVEGTSRA